MSSTPPETLVRPLTGVAELPLFNRLSYVLDHELEDDFAAGRRRPEWTWVALSGDRLLARLAWWTKPGRAEPMFLDFFDLDDALPEAERVEVGVRLLETASAAVLKGGPRPEYGRFVPADWRDDPAARAAVTARMTAAERTGARLLVERLRLEWNPAVAAVPAASGRLRFRPVVDREDLVALMALVMAGTLDAHGLADLASGLSPREAAEQHYDEEFAGYSSPREWWRVAELPDSGEPVGFVVPAHNGYNATIAYIGVLPAHRGHGYIDDVLAEGTRILAAEDVPRVRAATDLANVPMARAFARAGYVNFERAIDMTWDALP
ncbi:GNAT family N-acetyltransferase [Streptomyces sp. NPDC050504]|uniref:GNAT family N-acetyltransferase n=1 Tax=Streptomyces sp. NPDC050504 TaxID=3365618 RepID=UPI0037AC828A